MSLATLATKIAVVGTVGYFVTTSAEDLLAGIGDSVSVTAARADMKTFHNKFSEYYTLSGRYPNSPQELHRMLKEEFDTAVEITMTDPWGANYIFLGPEVEIRCCGPDKKALTRDDLTTPYPDNRTRPITRPGARPRQGKRGR